MKEPRQAGKGPQGHVLPSLSPKTVFANRYRIDALLSTGIYGQIYRVSHVKYGQKLLLKLFFPHLFGAPVVKEQFEAEFRKVKQLRDPGIVRYYDLGYHPESGAPYVTQEYLKGQSLQTLIHELNKAGTPFASADAVQIAIRLVETLCSIHEAGLSHRNIHPGSILIVTRGRASKKMEWDVRLTDFALVIPAGDQVIDVPSDRVPFMAPEQLGYGGAIGARTDIFAVGAVLHTILTGNPPDGSGKPPSHYRPRLHRKFDDIVELCLPHIPSDRYGSAKDLLSELRDLATTLPFDEPVQERSGLAPVAIILGVLLLVGLIAFISTLAPEAEIPSEGPEYWAHLRSLYEKEAIKESEESIEKNRTAAPEGMIYIPAGAFIRGALPGEPFADVMEPKAELVEMPGYYIDQYEFHAPKKKHHPYTSITWDAAEKACNKLGKRLCTEAEWERACKGRESLIYSYGDTYDPTVCPPLTSIKEESIGKNPKCISSYGVFDLSGGVQEWAQWDDIPPEEMSPNEVEVRKYYRPIKGGLAGSAEPGTRCAAINLEKPSAAEPTLGFRCCKEAASSNVLPDTTP